MQITTIEGRAAAQTAIDVSSGSGNPLATLTLAQAEAYIDSNVNTNTVAVIRASLKFVARLLILIRDQQAALRRRQAAIEERLTNAGL